MNANTMLPFPAATARISFRKWTEDDKAPLRRLNRDPKVMRYFPSPLSAPASDAFLSKLMKHQAEHGFTVWPIFVHEAETPTFAGCVGLLHVGFDAPFAPAVEVGWRLLPSFWGRGLATEAARACLQYAFKAWHMSDIVSFTAAINMPSRRVMERLAMRHDPSEDFNHPNLPEGHKLRPHVLYRLSN